jgi:hypothetical protein
LGEVLLDEFEAVEEGARRIGSSRCFDFRQFALG